MTLSHFEEWRPIPSLPHYEASSIGRVRMVPYEAPMPNGSIRSYGGKAKFGSWDGERFVMHDKHTRKTYRIARLVCEAFHGPAPEGAVCMHLDEDSANNLPENLRWGTQQENLNAVGFIEHCQSRTGLDSPTIKARIFG